MIDVPKDNAFAADTVIYWQNRAFTLEDNLNKANKRIEELEAQIESLQAEVNNLKAIAGIYDAMCDVGLIQFDPSISIPDRIYSVWGFTRWHHDQDIFRAILAVRDSSETPPPKGLEISNE